MNALERLELEAIPCNFGKPRPFTGDGPTARFMAAERLRALWAGEYTDDSTAVSSSSAGVAS